MSTNSSAKWIIGIVVVAVLAFAIGALVVGHSSSHSVGINNGAAVINYPEWETNGFYAGSQQQFSVNSSGQLTLGTAGSPITTIKNGTCSLSTASLPLAATTTATFTCAVTGATSAMNADINLPATQGAVYGGFVVVGTTVSANSIAVSIENLTGAATSSFPMATSSVGYTLTQ